MIWAVRLHPIIRLIGDPIPVLGTGSHIDMEALYFEKLEDESIDDFYLELCQLPSDGDQLIDL
jgi:hypothetical protein